jgi:hypothetical protein
MVLLYTCLYTLFLRIIHQRTDSTAEDQDSRSRINASCTACMYL